MHCEFLEVGEGNSISRIDLIMEYSYAKYSWGLMVPHVILFGAGWGEAWVGGAGDVASTLHTQPHVTKVSSQKPCVLEVCAQGYLLQVAISASPHPNAPLVNTSLCVLATPLLYLSLLPHLNVQLLGTCRATFVVPSSKEGLCECLINSMAVGCL